MGGEDLASRPTRSHMTPLHAQGSGFFDCMFGEETQSFWTCGVMSAGHGPLSEVITGLPDVAA